MKSFGVLAAAGLLAAAALAGTAFAGGIHPDPPPKPPPPPPPAAPAPPPPPVVAPPPPPAYVAPPPPPAPVVHAKARKHVHHAKAKQKHKKAAAKPTKPAGFSAKPLIAAGTPVAATTSGSLSPALLIVVFGIVLALLAVGLSFMPASAVPFAVGLRLERSRQTIMLVGLAIGVACALVGILTALVGR